MVTIRKAKFALSLIAYHYFATVVCRPVYTGLLASGQISRVSFSFWNVLPEFRGGSETVWLPYSVNQSSHLAYPFAKEPVGTLIGIY